MTDARWDAVVVGGGPAGLSAAFWLARYRRRTLVLDDDRPRNRAARAVHGFPGLPDPKPDDLRDRLTAQALGAGAALERRRVAEVTGEKDAFDVADEGGKSVAARRVLLAFGLEDRVPDLPGLAERYGASVFHCPDCDGPGVAGSRVGVLGHDRPAAALALYLLTWVREAVLLTGGKDPDLDPPAMRVLADQGIAVDRRSIVRLEGPAGRLDRVRFDRGERELDALFFHWGAKPASPVALGAGCACEPDGAIVADPRSLETSVPGIYAAGDIVDRPHLVVSAVAGGVRAALSIHRSLLPPEFEL